MHFCNILHPTDFSDLSAKALGYAAEMAHDHGGRLLILHAVDTLGPENVTYGQAVSEPQPASFRQHLWDELHQIKSPRPDIEVEYVLSAEEPAQAIIQIAQARHCDLIVMASHVRSGLRRFFMGSVAEEVVRHAPCPVLVVKPDGHQPPVAATAKGGLHPQFLTDKPEQRTDP